MIRIIMTMIIRYSIQSHTSGHQGFLGDIASLRKVRRATAETLRPVVPCNIISYMIESHSGYCMVIFFGIL